MIGRGIKLFNLFGFEIRLDWSWFVLAFLLVWSLAQGIFPTYYRGLSPVTYWWMGVFGALGLFLCIVLHEFGHSIVARRFGIPMKGITLFIFGGVAEMGGPPPNAKSEFFMAIAGPTVTALLVALFYGLAQMADATTWPAAYVGVLGYLAWINLILLVFNLVPAFPLDGGRVLRSALWAWKRDLRSATRIASACGSFFALLLIGWGAFNFIFGNLIGGVWWVLIGLFLRTASQASYQQVLLRHALEGEPVHRLMTPEPVTLTPRATVDEVVDNFLYRHPHKLFPVVQNDQLVGCLTIDRVKQVPREEWSQHTVGELTVPCSRDNTIESDADASQALAKMTEKHVSRLMVVDDGRLIGVLSLKDLVEFFQRKVEVEPA